MFRRVAGANFRVNLDLRDPSANGMLLLCLLKDELVISWANGMLFHCCEKAGLSGSIEI